MARDPKSQEFTDEETARRRDAIITHMLNTPPKPHSEMKLGKRKAKADSGVGPKKRGRPAKKENSS